MNLNESNNKLDRFTENQENIKGFYLRLDSWFLLKRENKKICNSDKALDIQHELLVESKKRKLTENGRTEVLFSMTPKS